MSSPEPDDGLVATRSRRSNAGSRLQSLLNAEDPIDDEEEIFKEFEDDDEFELENREDDEDDEEEEEEEDDENEGKRAEYEEGEEEEEEEGGEAEDDDETQETGEGKAVQKKRKASDITGEGADDENFSSSSESEEEQEEDEEAGEEELIKQQREKKRKEAAEKKKKMFEIKVQKQKPADAGSTPGQQQTASKPIKRRPRQSAADLLAGDRRVSKRSSAVKNTKDVIERLQQSEAKRASGAQQPTQKRVVHSMTQEERLEEAKITEQKNTASLNMFFELEEAKKQRQRAAMMARKPQMSSVLRYHSSTRLIPPRRMFVRPKFSSVKIEEPAVKKEEENENTDSVSKDPEITNDEDKSVNLSVDDSVNLDPEDNDAEDSVNLDANDSVVVEDENKPADHENMDAEDSVIIENKEPSDSVAVDKKNNTADDSVNIDADMAESEKLENNENMLEKATDNDNDVLMTNINEKSTTNEDTIITGNETHTNGDGEVLDTEAKHPKLEEVEGDTQTEPEVRIKQEGEEKRVSIAEGDSDVKKEEEDEDEKENQEPLKRRNDDLPADSSLPDVQGPWACRTKRTISLVDFPDDADYTKYRIKKLLLGQQALFQPKPPPPEKKNRKCVVTGRPARFIDPESKIPYASVEAYKIIQLVKNNGLYWNPTFGGIYTVPSQNFRHAKGVPEGFGRPKPTTTPEEDADEGDDNGASKKSEKAVGDDNDTKTRKPVKKQQSTRKVRKSTLF